MAWGGRDLTGHGSEVAAIEAAGGMWIVPRDATEEEIRHAVDGGARALELHRSDVSMLSGTGLEFLHVVSSTLEADWLRDLPSLRSLSLDAWSGTLDLAAFPTLEWLHVTEVERPQFPQFSVALPGLRQLALGQYKGTDLSPLAGMPALEHLALWQSRSLATLDGIDAFRSLAAMELATCSKLASLAGIEAASKLRAVILETCNRIDDLGPIAGLPELRLVQIEMSKRPSLAPLAGHPALEFVWLVGSNPPEEEIERLLESPRMRVLQHRRSAWMRGPDGWIHVENVYAMEPEQAEVYHGLVDEIHRLRVC